MTRTFLIATVAALAITAPAQAERGGRGQDGERAQKAQAEDGERAQKAQKAQAQGGGQRAKASADRGQARAQVRAQSSQRSERALQPRARAQERSVERRAAPRMQATERRVRAVETRQARPQVERRAKAVDNRARMQDRNVERQARTIENRTRASTQRVLARERVAPRRLKQEERRNERFAAQRVRQQDNRQSDHFIRNQDRAVARRATLQGQEVQRAEAWQTYVGRTARFDGDDRRERPARQRLVTVGQRINPDWYDDYAPVRYRASFDNTPDYYYRYDDDDGYLYQVRRDSNLVTALFPLLGGAYSVGQPLPYYQQSYYNVPLGYRSLYYDTPDSYYRYGDGAIYQVNPGSQLIQGIVALLTGQNFGIGQQMPLGYDTYNVPYAYRSSYYDTYDMNYRYDDGYIYGYDPRTRLIQSSYPLSYGGYAVGYPVPAAYPGYDYNVPYAYNDLYYDAPGYDYRYAAGGIYQVDPSTQLIAALVALVTGQNFGVGQQMPMGYDAYNVPYAYRDRYYDTDQYNYRYADGYIYQVDPQTRMIQAVIDAIV